MKRLQRIYKFKILVQTLEFTNKVGAAADEENHDPLILAEWGRVTLQRWTHEIKSRIKTIS